MTHLRFIILFITSCCAIENVKCDTSSSIPELLLDCYRENFTAVSRPPLTIPLLVELIRKVELNNSSSLNMRTAAASLLHGVKFDGIVKSTRTTHDDLAIPFRASGNKFYKHKLIVDYLTPGANIWWPKNILSTQELCFLHGMLSNTVDPWLRNDEKTTCINRSKMALEVEEEDASKISKCPLKQGVIKTKWGPVSIGHIIAATASVLQPEKVTFRRVAEAIKENKNNTDDPHNFVSPSKNVNTVWVSTIAGDLAQVVLSQATAQPTIGNSGFWNDTILPRAYYLKSDIWDLTDSEILGGIDAIILAEHINKWLEILDTTRLSQIIDMYYSNRGIAYDSHFKVNNRSTAFSLLQQNIVAEQVSGAVKLLQTIGAPSDTTLSDSDISELSSKVIDQYKSAAALLTHQYDNAEDISGGQGRAPLELIVILDDSYDSYSAQQLLYGLSEAIQVSYYGSKIGIINGEKGNWMTNVTSELFQLFTDLYQVEDKWPTRLSLGKSLETVIEYYQNQTTSECSSKPIKPIGKSLLVFSHDGRLTDSDNSKTEQTVTSIKSLYPDINIIYVSTDTNNIFKQLANNVYNNDIVINPTNDLRSLIHKLSDRLSKVPANIVKFYCNHTQVRFEDYITPDIETHYAIHRQYLKGSSITTKFSNNDYGELTICATTSNSSPDNRNCTNLTVNGEISFNSERFCTTESTCDLYYFVTANNTKTKCAENDCRYPDQVRIDITYEMNTGTALAMSNVILLVISYIVFVLY